MKRALFVTEKPSVAMDYVNLLKLKGVKKDGYIECEKAIFTWCVGHMVTMSYPEAYDETLKQWTLATLPFLPNEYKYEVIPPVKKQFNTVRDLLLREDVDTIYVCTDSGREGEYIYRLVDKMVGVNNKSKKRIWIDSQTEEEIKRGIKEAKDLSFYDSLADSAYLRAKEDYLQGINFSRLLTLIYGRSLSKLLKEKQVVVAVGRVMSCVLAMIVDREREIKNFQKTTFYKVQGKFSTPDGFFTGEWKVQEKSSYYNNAKLYSDNGFSKSEYAEELLKFLEANKNTAEIININKTKEKKNAPLLFNLAELQNECSKRFKINPDETLTIVQGLYEKKILTYPRTDARVLSSAVAKEIDKTLNKLLKFKENEELYGYVKEIIDTKTYSNISKSKYVDDSKITDHYAIIPTGEGIDGLNKLKSLEKSVFDIILRRFLAIFYPPAEYSKISIEISVKDEYFYANEKVCVKKGYLQVLNEKEEKQTQEESNLSKIKKSSSVEVDEFNLKEGETSPPKYYTSGSIILAMENAGKLIEDEELREHIKGAGIGTSATRAEILKKLERIEYISTNKKSQVLHPTVKGELIYETIKNSIPSLLNPKLTASWEKGLKMVTDKEINQDEFMDKLENYIKDNVKRVLKNNTVIDFSNLIDSLSTNGDSTLDRSNLDEVLGICPICHVGHIVKNPKGYGCTNWKSGCKFFLGEICGVEISPNYIRQLINTGKTSMVQGFISKKGNRFNACLKIENDNIVIDFN
ncbi:DNA topoisomerase [Clostridium sp.]|uniref:type IA DNA topoisomerase n=1 Tax=Clostridium sp. TaxID=1506 RepID=UPI002FC583BE